MKEIADKFVKSRLAGTALNSYPGTLPTALADAYAIQDAAIDQWPDEIGGWKIGLIPKAYSALNTERLVGPIFKNSIQLASKNSVDVFVFDKGFGAVEGECILILGEDAPSNKYDYTVDEAKQLIGDVHIGIEVASSPFAAINDAGPLVTISDFGNNNGLVLGPKLAPDSDYNNLSLTSLVDAVEVGNGNTHFLPGGPVGALIFLLENAAARGRPLKRGMCISTGAITGIHQVRPGQTAQIRAAGLAHIDVNIIASPDKTAGK